ncbi:MAG: helix-turn-helix transcriptional regulator [Clostridiales bacterium]|nr:helix-turn-helix transcriptional regulator [Clostridiales bacterium]
MTVGQRIAQKRKELGLSQEGLGERLGVSRQAIYKWESDAALPEIEKLVNLSREFSVSIDWLLGQEDEAQEPRELTPEQIHVVEEIVGRYLAARPPEPAPQEAPLRSRVRTWPWVLGAAVVIVVLLVFGRLFDRMDKLNQSYCNLSNSVSDVNRDVNRQIDSIARRVEEVLQNQNSLTAEQSAEVTATDYRANTVTVSARALPRTYVEGMTAEFILASGGETVTVPGERTEGFAFTAELTGPLTDEITVSVVFLAGDRRETQVVEQFRGLYEISLPIVMIHSGAWCWREGRWIAQDWVQLGVYSERDRGTKAASIQLGLFRDGKRVAWYQEAQTEPANGAPGQNRTIYFSLGEEIPLEVGASYALGALVTDEYGREWVVAGETYIVEELEMDEMITSRQTDPSELTF